MPQQNETSEDILQLIRRLDEYAAARLELSQTRDENSRERRWNLDRACYAWTRVLEARAKVILK